MSINVLATTNFEVPVEGLTSALTATLPVDGNLTTAPPAGGGYYGIDFRSLASLLNMQSFVPQAVTVDATGLVAGTTVTMSIPALGNLSWQIFAGETRTFQFPALTDLQVVFTPSSGTPAIKTTWYNYPALPDDSGAGSTNITGSVSVSGAVSVTALPTSSGTDVSANSPALLGQHLASLPASATRKGFVVQNNSAETVQVVFTIAGGGTGDNPTVLLLAANTAGAGNPGGSIDFAGMPHAGQIDVYGATSTDQVAVRDWT